MSSVSGAGSSGAVQSQQPQKSSSSSGAGDGARRFNDVVREKQSTASQEQPKADDKPKTEERRNDDKVRDADKDQKTERKDEKKADRPKEGEAPKEQKVTDDGKGKGGGGGGDGGLGGGEGELASLEGLEGEEAGEAAKQAKWEGQLPSPLMLREQSQPVEGASKTRSLDKIFPKEAVDKVVQAVRVGMNEQGLKEIQIDLKAEALEGLKLKISQGKDGVKVEMVAETQQVRDLMAQRVEELQKVLEAKGIQVNELTVRTVSDVQTDNRQFSGDRGDERRKQQEESALDGVGGARRRKKGAVAAPPPPFDFSPPKKGKVVKKKGGKEFTV